MDRPGVFDSCGDDLLKADAGNCGTAWRGGAWSGVPVDGGLRWEIAPEPGDEGSLPENCGKAPGIPCCKEAEGQAVDQFRFQTGKSASIDQQVFNPDLRAFADENHLSAQAEMRGQSAQGSGEHEVGIERFADLLCSQSAEGKVKTESRARMETDGWRTRVSRAMVSSATACPRCSGTP